MSTWLYQINPKYWPPQRYRLEIWEGERWAWSVWHKVLKGHTPQAVDVVVFFNTAAGGQDSGFLGWAVILEWFEFEDGTEMYFRPVAPSDQLKMHPWGDQEAIALANEIRGKVKRGTFWYVDEEMTSRLRRGISGWVCNASSQS